MNSRILQTVSASALVWTLLAGVQDAQAYALETANGGEVVAISAADAAASPAIAQEVTDGIYSLSYEFHKFNTDQVSVMQEYVINPGQLIVKDGRMLAQITLKQNKEITDFKIETNGSLETPEIVATDEQNNTRTVQFEVKDLTATLKGWVKIYWQVNPTFLYDHEYDIDLTFDKSSLKQITTDANSEPSEGQKPQVDADSTNGGERDDAKADASPLPVAEGIADLEGHWAKAAVERAVSLKIVNGYEDGTFRPNGNINRGEFAAMLGRALQLEDASQKLNFSDEARIPEWVKPNLGAIVNAGIIGGYEDGTFRADRQISRAELVVIIVRALKLDVDAESVPGYSDTNLIPKWAQPEIAAASQAGIISGRDGNVFAPDESATRAEAVSLIMSLVKNSN